jgi:hypothetical protein
MRPFMLSARAFSWVALLAATGRGDQPQPDLPDIIVSAIAVAGRNLVVEVQNQGPGAAKADTKVEALMSRWQTLDDKFKPKGITVSVPVPVKPMAVERVTVPLVRLGLKNFNSGVSITLDPKKKLAESRPDNNTFAWQLDDTGAMGRAAYVEVDELPDLVITDVFHDDSYLRVTYMNVGKGATGADFTINLRSGEQSYPGNTWYRRKVPPPGQKVQTGGFTLGLIGLKRGMEADVEVIIDPEDRVRETTKYNNTFTKKVVITPEP